MPGLSAHRKLQGIGRKTLGSVLLPEYFSRLLPENRTDDPARNATSDVHFNLGKTVSKWEKPIEQYESKPL
jgi:hypothetical protein